MYINYFAYVFAYKEEGPVKIGISSNPKKRMKQIQTGCPEKLYPVVIRNFQEERIAKFAEKHIHTLLKHEGHTAPSGNEWFSISTKHAESIVCEFPYHDEISDEDGNTVEPYSWGNFIADCQDEDEYYDICQYILSRYDKYYQSGDEPDDPLGSENFGCWDDVFPLHSF